MSPQAGSSVCQVAGTRVGSLSSSSTSQCVSKHLSTRFRNPGKHRLSLQHLFMHLLQNRHLSGCKNSTYLLQNIQRPKSGMREKIKRSPSTPTPGVVTVTAGRSLGQTVIKKKKKLYLSIYLFPYKLKIIPTYVLAIIYFFHFIYTHVFTYIHIFI